MAFRRRKATAVLAILFADVEGSVQLREELGERTYEEMRLGFDALIVEVFEEGDAGAIVKGTGDGAMVVFSEPSMAVERALACTAGLVTLLDAVAQAMAKRVS